ncbi:hypothetical protein QL285_076955 [Trifolium repens]|jgi:hypothetical protein|nr:hypothetical protein QL285_076955 [Trifolium repens]
MDTAMHNNNTSSSSSDAAKNNDSSSNGKAPVAPDMPHVDIEPILENFDDSRVLVVHEKSSNPIDIENECLRVDSSVGQPYLTCSKGAPSPHPL